MSSDNSDDLAFEAATNKRYVKALAERLSRTVEVAMPANEKWLGNIPTAGISYDDFGPFAGRVGLDIDDEALGTAFYIGSRWLPDFEQRVVSWAAPMAKIFFEPNGTTQGLVRNVVVRRTMLARLNDIVKVYDTWSCDVAPDHSPFVARRLVVPSAPGAAERRRSADAIRTHRKSSTSHPKCQRRLRRDPRSPYLRRNRIP